MLSAQASGHPYEIILVDDASTDQALEEVATVSPYLRILHNETNLGFGASVNKGVEAAQAEIVVLLNNDLSPCETMIRELVNPLLNNETLFAVSGKTVDWYSGEPNHVNMMGRITEKGFCLAYEDSKDLTETLFFQGGSAAVRRSVFLDFGGFCPLFHPGYWEDYDLSYLAWKCGWRILYNPRAVGAHVGQGSMKKAYGEQRIALVRVRNSLIFQWLNFGDPEVVHLSCKELPRQFSAAFAQGQTALWRGIFMAFQSLREVLIVREARSKLWKVSDHDIFRKFEGRGHLC